MKNKTKVGGLRQNLGGSTSLTNKPQSPPSDLRKNRRFPIELPLRFDQGRHYGAGNTLNLSSSGVLFECDPRGLELGEPIALILDWPVKLDGDRPLALWITGIIVRIDGRKVAARVKAWEFHLAGKKARLAA